MKLNKKLITFGSSMFLLGGAIIPAIGESWLETIQVRKGVNLQLEGQTVQPHDASGKPMPVMLYESTTYVPVRFISEYYGKNVGWDPNTTTVSINTPSGTGTPSTRVKNLLELEPDIKNAMFWIQPSAIALSNGDSVTNAMEFTNVTNMVQYHLGSQYSRLTFKGCAWNQPYYNSPAEIRVIGGINGQSQILFDKVVNYGTVQDISCNLQGVDDLQIKIVLPAGADEKNDRFDFICYDFQLS